ncbi:MAG: hypothetical protein B6I35_10855 [Anaerolineaceae bacterium 4572_32.2]|nr:MAG: hypothetical protein B6I35_10855 [Anaerolineaceae bacterium 4572_32.2]
MEEHTQARPVSWKRKLYFLAYYAILPAAVTLLVSLGWYAVFHQSQTLTQAAITAYQQTELEIVRMAARSVNNYVHDQIEIHGRSDIVEIEQEIFRRFIAPILLLEHGDAWIYAPDHVVFDLSSDFPDEYRGKSMAEIFALQVENGASHYEEMTEAVTNAREGVGWYIWLPDKGKEIAAWTPVRVGERVWTIGLSTPLPEILESTGAARQMQVLRIMMSWETVGALVLLLAWVMGTLQRQRTDLALRESEAQYRQSVENSPNPIFSVDRQGIIQTWTPACGRFFQYEPEEVIGQPYRKLLWEPDDARAVKAMLAQVWQGRSLSDQDMTYRSQDGTQRFTVSRLYPLRDPDGSVRGCTFANTDVTARVRAEREIKERRIYLEGVLAATPDAIVTLNAQHKIVEWNPGAERLFGYSPEEAMGRDLDALITNPGVREEALGFTSMALDEGKPTGPVETVRYRQDGSPVNVILTGAPIILDGELIGAVAVYTNITARVRAAEALRESEKKYRELVDNSLVGIYITQNHVLKFCNQGLADIFGYRSIGEIEGEHVRDLVAPESWERVDREVRLRESAQKDATRYEFRGVRQDGATFDVEVLGKRITYHGKPAIQGTMIDVTERKRAERLLQALNQAALAMGNAHTPKKTLAAVAATLKELGFTCMILLVDENQSKLSVEYLGIASRLVEAAEKLAGIKRQDILIPIENLDTYKQVIWEGKTIFIEDVTESMRQALPGFAKRLAGRLVEMLNLRTGIVAPLIVEGEAVGLLSVQADDLTESDTPVIIAFAHQVAAAWRKAELFEQARREIVERKRVEDVLRQRTAELEARNEELDAFAHTVAHDLKAPLTPIIAYAEILAEDYAAKMDPQELQFLRNIARGGHRMGRIIDELMLLAGLREMDPQFEPLDMAAIVSEVQARLAQSIEQSRADITLPETWPAVLGYGPWVEEVWVNYLSNALKYGGKPEEGAPPRIELGFDELVNSHIRFWIRDNGLSLTPEEQAQLFTSFTRLNHARAEGHGLGLSIVRRIVEKLGGQVGVEGEIGRGNLFFFTLPGIEGSKL